MGRCLLGLALLASACSARLADDTPPDGPPGIDSLQVIDAAPDAFVLGAWGPPMGVAGASSTTLAEEDGTPSSTTLELVFTITTSTGRDLYYASRSSPTVAWTTPTPMALNLATSSEETPRFSGDDLTLYFASNRVTANGLDVFQVTRTAVGAAWSAPAPVVGPNATTNEKWFTPCGGMRYLVIVGGDIAEGRIGQGAPTVVTSLSAPTANETGTFITQDCLTAYFASTRSGTNKLYTSTRSSPLDPWPAPTRVDDFMALGGNQEDPWLAPDQRTFMFVSDIGGTKDVYVSTR